MTRSELQEVLLSRFPQLQTSDADRAVRLLLDALSEALAQGQRVEIRGFGSFVMRRRAPRLGRNPRTGESVQVAEKRTIHFKPGKALRDGVAAYGRIDQAL